MLNKKARLHGTQGAENYFGDVTNWDFNNPFDEDARETPKQQVVQRDRYPNCRDEPNSINCRNPQFNAGKSPEYIPYLANLAKWFYDGEETDITIGDPDPVLKYSYSVGNYNERKTDWGWDTLQWKEQMGGRYDGKTRYPQEDTGYEDWYHEYPQIRDFSHVWLRYNKGDEDIQDFLRTRWQGDQESDWPGVDLSTWYAPAEGPAFPAGYDLRKLRKPSLLRDASINKLSGSLKKLANLLKEM